ncbi:MAG: PEP-CTERM sorting domain-containing protein [Fibrobacterota bacterium]|nr:PEP-CTERM sorting domain-containing protein [Fibrobacterota bacterium]
MTKTTITTLTLSLAVAQGVFAIPFSSAHGALKNGLIRAEAANADHHTFLWAECTGLASLRGPATCDVIDFSFKSARKASESWAPNGTPSNGGASGHGFGLGGGVEDQVEKQSDGVEKIKGVASIPAIEHIETIPEPRSLALLGLGLLGIFAVSRRKRKA